MSQNPFPSSAKEPVRLTLTLLCASGASFMIMLDSNIVAVSLSTLAKDLHASFSAIEWVISSYILAFIGLLMPAGALADRFGRRRMLLLGLGIFTTASLLCGMASSIAILNISRVLQGAGAAIQLSAGLAVISEAFAGPERARAFGTWGVVMGLAAALGPPVGGLITAGLGWRWAFLINLPVGILLVGLGSLVIRESRDLRSVRLDIAGMSFFGPGLSLLVWTIIGANNDGWLSSVSILRLGSSVAFLGLFVIVERRQQRPMIDLDLFRKRTFLGSAVAMLAYAATAQVLITLLPLSVQLIFSLPTERAGLAMMPFALPFLVVPRFASWIASRASGRMVLTSGLLIVAVSDLAIGLSVALHLRFGVMAWAMMFCGCGAGILNSETAKISMSVVPPERSGMASGISGTLRFVGIVLGLTGLGAVLSAVTSHNLRMAMQGMHLPYAITRDVLSHIVAGDLESAFANFSVSDRDILSALARESFAGAFSIVMVITSMIAATSATLAWHLFSPSKTGPLQANVDRV